VQARKEGGEKGADPKRSEQTWQKRKQDWGLLLNWPRKDLGARDRHVEKVKKRVGGFQSGAGWSESHVGNDIKKRSGILWVTKTEWKEDQYPWCSFTGERKKGECD